VSKFILIQRPRGKERNRTMLLSYADSGSLPVTRA
jgi:hypothetical protein